ncbi:HTH-type transcriptional repressor CytR [compost metagenome]
MSVIGFDDIVLAEAFDPPLTTIRQPRREIGRQAMTMLIEQMSGSETTTIVELETELVLRASVSTAAQADS